MSAAWVYVCRDASDRVIYVGATSNLFARLAQHKASSFWAITVTRVTATVHPSMPAALAVERATIATLDPRWNIKGRWQNRLRWNAEDYRDFYTAIHLGHSSYTSQNRALLAKVERECNHRFGVVLGGAA